MKRSLEVAAIDAGKRLDLFVGEKLELSRAKLKALFEEEAVRVDGRKAKKGQSIAAGQKVEVELIEQTGPAVAPEPEANLTVLHQDDQLVFIDKPANVPVHPLAPGEKGTVANALVARFAECATAGADPREAGLVHRLDVETSGVLLAARSRDAWESLRAQFSGDGDGGADKRYLALVSGPIADEGDIELPLSHRGDHVRPAMAEETDARPARSHFRVLERQGLRSLVEVQIFTGVLHQVRAHLAAVGAPIVGDALYGGVAEPRLNRFFLHAASLEVTHPKTGERLKVSSPLPQELAAVR